MANRSTPEWARFRVGQPSTTSNWTNLDCQELTSIEHVTHIDMALRMMADGKMKSGLVFDESKLRTNRILVTWLSPNRWFLGSRYGNVSFSFDWNSLIQGMNYYWVESIQQYNPAALRILITDRDRQSILDRYDPTKGDGPWWQDESTRTHYWNGKFCLEIMVERDLQLTDCIKVDFVDHHKRFCNIEPLACDSCGLSKDAAGSAFLSAVVAEELDPSPLGWVSDGQPEWPFLRAAKHLRDELNKRGTLVIYTGTTRLSSPAAEAISRALLGAYSKKNDDDLLALMGLFDSSDKMLKSCEEVITETFNLSDPGSLFVNLDSLLPEF